VTAPTAASVPRVDGDNPWPGLAAFDESGSGFFHGRDEEVSRLLQHVLDNPVTVLFGRSGMGKTSLLRAGLFPHLRGLDLLPVYIRLDIRPDATSLIDQLRGTTLAAIEHQALEASPARPDETLWAYLHRVDIEIWSHQNHLLRPVIVLDQFEEIFTIGERAPDLVREFRDGFGDLVENRIPEELASRLEQDEGMAAELDLRALNYKLIVSLREDHLPDLDGWCTLIPALSRVRHRLVRMKVDAAVDAVFRPAAGRITHDQAVRVVEIVAGRGLHGEASSGTEEALEVEPALLSLFCRELNDERMRRGLSSLDGDLIEGAKRDILSNYYRSCVQHLPERVAQFIETSLITERGFRDSFAREDAVPLHLTEGELDELVLARLLRLEDRHGTVRIELTHDVLTTVVREHRDLRRAEQDKAAAAAAAAEELRALEVAAAQRERELEAAQEAERARRLVVEARAAKRLRWLAVGLALLLTLAVVAAVGAIQSQVAAEQARGAAEQAQLEVAAARDKAVRANTLTEGRVTFLQQANAIKRAVSTDDRQAIARFVAAGTPTVKIIATQRSLGFRGASGAEQFHFTLGPDPATLPTDRYGGVAAITYRFHRDTFQNPLMAAGADRMFVATYDGRCVSDVVVLVEFFDPERLPEITQFDMCAALGPR
jgi:hypothetical protein